MDIFRFIILSILMKVHVTHTHSTVFLSIQLRTILRVEVLVVFF
jgi:hypothetical protein